MTRQKRDRTPKHLLDLLVDSKDYDRLGRNTAEQRKRQNEIPWTKVRYHRGRLINKGPV